MSELKELWRQYGSFYSPDGKEKMPFDDWRALMNAQIKDRIDIEEYLRNYWNAKAER